MLPISFGNDQGNMLPVPQKPDLFPPYKTLINFHRSSHPQITLNFIESKNTFWEKVVDSCMCDIF